MCNYTIIDGISNLDIQASLNEEECWMEFEEDWDDPFVDDEFEPTEDDWDDGYYSNCHCDTYGVCGGVNCPNYFKCNGGR